MMCACEPGFTCRRCAQLELDSADESDEQRARERWEDAGRSEPLETKRDG